MNEKEEKDALFTEFDYQMTDPHLQMMKAALPYIPPAQQRIVALLIRIQETRRTMELFRDGDVAAMGLSNSASSSASPLEMLQSMKPYAGPRERDMIEMLENIQIMIQAMQAPT